MHSEIILKPWLTQKIYFFKYSFKLKILVRYISHNLWHYKPFVSINETNLKQLQELLCSWEYAFGLYYYFAAEHFVDGRSTAFHKIHFFTKFSKNIGTKHRVTFLNLLFTSDPSHHWVLIHLQRCGLWISGILPSSLKLCYILKEFSWSVSFRLFQSKNILSDVYPSNLEGFSFKKL